LCASFKIEEIDTKWLQNYNKRIGTKVADMMQGRSEKILVLQKRLDQKKTKTRSFKRVFSKH